MQLRKHLMLRLFHVNGLVQVRITVFRKFYSYRAYQVNTSIERSSGYFGFDVEKSTGF